MIEYKGYIGAVDFDPEIDLFHGTVINTNDVITFYGSSVSELREEMQKSIEGYLEFCTEQGITPENPFSGEFTIQTSPEMHCKLALNAERLNLDFNVYLQEVLEEAVFSLEKYLLKSNVASGKAERNVRMALKEKEKADTPKLSPIPKQPVAPSEFSDEWTVERIRNLVPEEVRDYQKTYPEERRNIFYRRITEIQNLIEAEGWRLKLPKFNKQSCSFQLMDRGVTRIRSVFGILLDTYLPHANLVGRNGEKIPDLSIKSNPPRIFAPIKEEEAMKLERQHGCEFWGISERKIYYDIPDDITELRPVLAFAYKKHSGN